jgi:hypothetical protein
MIMSKFNWIAAGALALAISQPASAGLIEWTDWTSATTGAAGTAAGSLGTITVGYTGDVAFAQTGAGTNYWTEPNAAARPYTGNSVVDNAPTAAEMVAMNRAGITNTVTFSETVWNPIMAIVSQGQPGHPVAYDFDHAFTVLSEGQGYWGNGTYSLLPGDVLKGWELHAVIQFDGALSSLSWVADVPENWHGFTFGLGSQPTSVPAPGGLVLFGLGLVGLGLRRRSRS